MIKKRYLLIVGLMLMVVGTFYDWQISVFLTNITEGSFLEGFVWFFRAFGPFMPFLICALFFGFFANFGYRKFLSDKKFGQWLFNLFLLVVSSTLVFVLISDYLAFKGVFMYLGSLGLGLVLSVIIFKFMDTIEDYEYFYYRRVAIMGLCYLITVLVFVEGLKMLWARPRYWYIAQGDSTFVPWYIINGTGHTGITDGAFKSFPSGHTAHGFLVIYLALWTKSRRKEVFIFGIVWGTLTAISRVIGGYHFVTDVTISAIFTVTVFFVYIKLFDIKLKK